ncbi:MAG TPA: YeeE/YedE thiosulfate transporter family protein [Myxococcales bacterium]|jgi:hypothetical protein
MEGPLSVVLKFNHATEMLVALVVGIGFGFVLERAGFGRSDNLAAIFYGRDFRVMRVMFTGIVTTMLGLYFLDLVNVLPLSSVGLLDTYVLPQLVGGLLLGAGFIVGGYCPGTSAVGVGSGKTDAFLFVGGLMAGTVAFTFAYDAIGDFQKSTSMGRVLLHEYFHVPSAVMVLAVVLFAVGAFFAVGKIEAAVQRSLKR